MTTRILCATDGSAHSDAALAAAAEMAARFGAPLSLIAVNIQVPEGRGRSHPLWSDQQFDDILNSARQKATSHATVEVETATGAITAVDRDSNDMKCVRDCRRIPALVHQRVAQRAQLILCIFERGTQHLDVTRSSHSFHR